MKMQNCFRFSSLVIIMAYSCWGLVPWLLPSNGVTPRKIASMSRPVWSSARRPSLMHASRRISIQAAVDVEGKDENTKPTTTVTKHHLDHTDINDAYGMIYHGSVPSHSKTAASQNKTDVAIDESVSTKGDVLRNDFEDIDAHDGAVLKVMRFRIEIEFSGVKS